MEKSIPLKLFLLIMLVSLTIETTAQPTIKKTKLKPISLLYEDSINNITSIFEIYLTHLELADSLNPPAIKMINRKLNEKIFINRISVHQFFQPKLKENRNNFYKYITDKHGNFYDNHEKTIKKMKEFLMAPFQKLEKKNQSENKQNSMTSAGVKIEPFVRYNKNGLITVSLIKTTFLQGARDLDNESYCFELKTGEIIRLNDMFVEKYHAKLYNMIKKKWKDKSDEKFPAWIYTDFQKLNDYLDLDDDNLSFYFLAGPNPIGLNLSIEIPWEELSDIIDKNGPLKPFLKN